MTRSFPFRACLAPLAIVVAACWSIPASAQIPDKFTNLKVLPQDISKRELIAAMRNFSMGLGVRCDHCHVEESAANPKERDFASDAKKEKKIARAMMGMVREINATLLPKSGIEAPLPVSCVTCHHGVARPQTLVDILKKEFESGGIDSVRVKYRALREATYGSGAYDFKPMSLAALSEWLSEERGNLDGALAVARFSLEVDPDAALTYALIGRIEEAKGDKTAAMAGYRKALELDPSDGRAKHALEKLESGK